LALLSVFVTARADWREIDLDLDGHPDYRYVDANANQEHDADEPSEYSAALPTRPRTSIWTD